MPRVCPKLCGRLATAAIFISVGVVQFIAGLILLKSEYVYLLAVPNFWTSSANLSVGILLGVSAGVWRNTQKISSKHAIRRNLLSALVSSSIMMNTTTAAIIILGKGNALMSMHLENKGIYSSPTVGSELLAYAYATSVCSPIVCVVVAIIFLTGLCFRKQEKKHLETPEIKSILKKDAYSWVFKPGQKVLPQQDPRIIRRALSMMSLSSSDDDSFSSTDPPIRSNSILSVEGLDNSLQRALPITRTHSDSTAFQQQNCQCEEGTGETERGDISQGRNRVSFANDYLKSKKKLKDLRLPLPKHSRQFEIGKHSNSKDSKTRNDTLPSLNYLEYPDMHQPVGKLKLQTKRKRKLLVEHPAFGGIEIPSRYGMLHDADDPSSYRTLSASKSQINVNSLARKSLEVMADVYTDPKSMETKNKFRHYEISPEHSALVYEADVSSSDIFGKSNDNIYSFTNPKIHRTSSTRSIRSLNGILCLECTEPSTNKHEMLHRTSTATGSHSPEEVSYVDNLQLHTDVPVHPIEYHNFIVKRQTPTRVSHSSVQQRTCPDDSNMDSTLEVLDASFDTTKKNCLAGEVVPVLVNNSLLRKKLSSKLIPVSIPVVSDAKQGFLGGAKTSDDFPNSQKPTMNRNRAKTVRISKFDGVIEGNFSSFQGDTTIKGNNRRRKTLGAEGLKQLYYGSSRVSPEQTADERTKENYMPSPAQTSGYMSAFEENLELSGRSNFKSEGSILNTSTPTDGSLSIHVTPQKKHRAGFREASQITWASSESDAIKEIVNQIVGDNSTVSSKRELIDQLLNDHSFQKAVQRTLRKDTDV